MAIAMLFYFINFDKNECMDTLIRMNVDDLNESLIEFLRTSFKGRNMEVSILEEQAEMDETEYILGDPIARKEILQSIEDVKNGVGLKTYTINELKQEFLNEPQP